MQSRCSLRLTRRPRLYIIGEFCRLLGVTATCKHPPRVSTVTWRLIKVHNTLNSDTLTETPSIDTKNVIPSGDDRLLLLTLHPVHHSSQRPTRSSSQFHPYKFTI
ncbi:hypothetical protein RSOL_361800 [Rhizoctonia solani AG-3 Rhs1AP]|uniref:Uncharacterized protein n=2 Tax=Rhizoctonia solani AG-3 TaxID=1086053 RepID=A0A074SD08_9AGAM|nr:hypothetical protein RSOL_361800 [Rhizoctonia solani AG-3 Rhs1AP]KEP47927.1 hypothetical protein V565_139320 [Rhizoctonia solani 123E]